MLNKFLRGLISLVGVAIGYSIASIILSLDAIPLPTGSWISLSIYIGMSLLFGIIFLSLSTNIINRIKKLVKFIEKELQNFSIYDIFMSSVGLIIGLIIAYLVSMPIYNLEIAYISMVIPVFLYVILGYLGVTFPYKKKGDIKSFVETLKKETESKEESQNNTELVNVVTQVPKILDTSVIIDGRILDICRTKFIEGPLVIPEFVLKELQNIADSSDSLKRTRGRRGLDILNEIQKDLDIEVIIHDAEYSDVKEVDTKLLKLTKELNGQILTNDYNLNKVAEVQGITVLNINDLANAVKPVVLPGEEMSVDVVKDGKEANQGLAYLDDGTMIVVESGKKYIGDTIMVIVTSVLQTSAGRMIFARPKKA